MRTRRWMATVALAAALVPVTFASAALPAAHGTPAARPMVPASAGRLIQGPLRYLPPRTSRTALTAAGTNNNLVYGGGRVAPSPAVYVVFWGSQWSQSDPYAAYLQNFLRGLDAGDGWTNVAHQYCEGVAIGTVSCGTNGTHIGVASGPSLKGVWWDNALPAVPLTTYPVKTGGVDWIGAEAVRAAAHFGNTSVAANVNAQYVIALPHLAPSPGEGVLYCSYHSTVSSSYGEISYTNLPYQNDLGPLCGQNAVNSGSAGTYDAVSIVEGAEFIDTITDMDPSLGWIDSAGQEAADKCATGPVGSVTTAYGTFAVGSIWSNEANGGAGACVMSS